MCVWDLVILCVFGTRIWKFTLSLSHFNHPFQIDHPYQIIHLRLSFRGNNCCEVGCEVSRELKPPPSYQRDTCHSSTCRAPQRPPQQRSQEVFRFPESLKIKISEISGNLWRGCFLSALGPLPVDPLKNLLKLVGYLLDTCSILVGTSSRSGEVGWEVSRELKTPPPPLIPGRYLSSPYYYYY